ncbi:MAG TPA: transglycosylase SLT domain-containing protein [Rhodopila sp.]
MRPIAAIGDILMAPLVWFWPAQARAVSCAQAAAIAETAASLPPGLLLAIGNVESGRIDASGQRAPWPWTINAAGNGRFFESAEEAMLATERLRASGVESIDVGCFQINLFHHPDAFPDLAHGFDPLANAEAAARFLTALHEEFGTWEPAIAAYHSRLDTAGAPYRDQVLAAWHGAVISRGVRFGGVYVWGPGGELGVDNGASPPNAGPKVFGASRRGLPRIITASVLLPGAAR